MYASTFISNTQNCEENARRGLTKNHLQRHQTSTFFSVKDKVPKEHCSNLIYYFKRKTDENAYTGETKMRLGKRIKEHQGGDKNSAIVLDFQEKNLPPPSPSEFTILGRNYNNRIKRKIAESLIIKEKKSNLNVQVDAYKLKLFN